MGGGGYDGSLDHMAYKAAGRFLVARTKPDEDAAAGSGKVTFCKLTDFEKRGLVSGDGGWETKGNVAGVPDVDHGDSLDTRERERERERERAQAFIARLKKIL